MKEKGTPSEQLKKSVGSKRRPEPEILRCLAMMMVVVLHFLAKGKLLGDLGSGKLTGAQTAAWVMEAFAIGAVNLYMLLSGYFLSKSHFKVTRFLQLILQMFTYSVVIGLLGVLLGWVSGAEVNTYYYLQMIFPFLQGQYWFVTVYLFLYLFFPLLQMAVARMDKRAFQILLVVLLLVFCVSKTVLPFRMEIDKKGYDLNWYLCEFLVAAYIRRFGLPKVLQKKWKGVTLYLAASLAIFGATMALQALYLSTGRLGTWILVCCDYNHLLPFLAALGLFCAFVGQEEKERKTGVLGRTALWAGPYTLGVYLLHECIGVRFVWPTWFMLGEPTVITVVASTLLAAICVFTAGVAVEFVRCKLMHALHVIFLYIKPYRWGYEKLLAADACFAREGSGHGEK